MTEQRILRLEDAIVAARAGQRETAYQLLKEIVAENPSNAEAWLWLSGVELDPFAQQRALERVLQLEPSNRRAQQGLEWLRQQYPSLMSGPSKAADTPIFTPVETPTAQASSAETAVLHTAAIDTQPPVDEESISITGIETRPDATTADEEMRCPYCGEWATVDDATCPRCQHSLIVPAHRRIGARIGRTLVALFWLLGTVGAFVGAWWAWTETGRIQAGRGQIGLTVDALGGPIPPVLLAQMTSVLAISLAVLGVLGILFTVGMFLRWRAVFVLQTIVLIMLIAVAATVTVVIWNGARFEISPMIGFYADFIVVSVLAPVIAVLLVLLFLTLGSRREFFPQYVRLILPVEALSGAEHFKRGSQYQNYGWPWAAAREFEHAVDQSPQNGQYRRALADVYSGMGDDVRARSELRASLSLPPDNVQGQPAIAVEEVNVEDNQRGR